MTTVRVRVAWRILVPLALVPLLVPFVGFAVAPEYWEVEPDLLSALAGVIAFGLLFGTCIACVWRAALRWDDREVHIRNLLSWRRHAWTDIKSVEASYFGIIFRLHSGQVRLSIVAQKANAAIGVETRVDRIVAAMEGARSGQPL